MATSRAASNARTQILNDLKDDHKRVKKAYRDFQKLDSRSDSQACAALVQQVLQDLTVHASLEEELLYPAARRALPKTDLIDEAEVEHESVHTLIEQLRGMRPEDEKYAARFKVLCEYVLHHVKEEEGEMFPELEKAKLDWESLGKEMASRRQGLLPAEETVLAGGGSDDLSPVSLPAAGMAGSQGNGRSSRSGAGDSSSSTPSGGRSRSRNT